MKMKTIAIYLTGICMTACNPTSTEEREKDEVEQAQHHNENNRIEDETSVFVTEAASGGIMEVQLGKKASEKAVTADVKQYGQMMAEAHHKTNQTLKEIALNKNIAFPDEMSEKHQNVVDDISSRNGIDFDKAYINQMVEDHKQTIQKFERAAVQVQDTQLRNFASSTLPDLKHHLEIAEKTRDIINDKK